jgi:hypothetical protein
MRRDDGSSFVQQQQPCGYIMCNYTQVAPGIADQGLVAR